VKVLTVDFSTTPSASYEYLGRVNDDRIEIQVDWINLTGTLDAKVEVFQRLESTMEYRIIDLIETIKVMNTTSDGVFFPLWKWCGLDLKIVVTRNNTTGGTVNVALGIRR